MLMPLCRLLLSVTAAATHVLQATDEGDGPSLQMEGRFFCVGLVLGPLLLLLGLLLLLPCISDSSRGDLYALWRFVLVLMEHVCFVVC